MVLHLNTKCWLYVALYLSVSIWLIPLDEINAGTRYSGCLISPNCQPSDVGTQIARTSLPDDHHQPSSKAPRNETSGSVGAQKQADINFNRISYQLRSRKKPPVSTPEPTLHLVPDLLDNLYRYNVNSTSDLVTYRKPDGTMVQLYSYWADDRRLHVTERVFPEGNFSEPIDVQDAVLGYTETLKYDSHNSSAIGVAPNGVMFITGNHHVSELNMAISTTPYDLKSFVEMLPEDMVALTEVNRVTYPLFFTHKDFLYFSYREQDTGQGAPRFRWMINRYNAERNEWTTAVQFNTGIHLRLYVSNVAVEPDDGSMHVFAVWREDLAGGGVASQRDYMHLYSTDGTTWRIKKSDTTVSASQPLWYDNGDTTLPGYTGTELTSAEKIWSTPPDAVPRGAGAATVDKYGRPHGLVKAYDGTLYHHYWNRKRWQSNRLEGWVAQSFEMVACPNDTGALLSDDGKIYYRSVNSSKSSYNTPVLLADGYTTADYSMSVDKEALKIGYVSFLLTSNSHFEPGQHDPLVIVNSQKAWIATFHCDRLNDATAFVAE